MLDLAIILLELFNEYSYRAVTNKVESYPLVKVLINIALILKWSHCMGWEEWIAANKKEIEHVAGYEEQFVRCILARVPEIRPEDVIAQYHFIDSNGGNRYIDFMIINEAKGYKLPIELDGYWKVQTYREFDDMLKRQNDLVKIYNVLLRYTNKKMELDPQGIIDEIRHTLHLQNTNQLSVQVTEEQTAKRFEEYQNQLAWYEQQLSEQADKLQAEQDRLTAVEQSIKTTEKDSTRAADIITKSDIAELQATIAALQVKIEEVGNNKETDVNTAATTQMSNSEAHTGSIITPPIDSYEHVESNKTRLTLGHMVAIGSASLIVVALGANAYFSNSGSDNDVVNEPIPLSSEVTQGVNEEFNTSDVNSNIQPDRVTVIENNIADKSERGNVVEAQPKNVYAPIPVEVEESKRESVKPKPVEPLIIEAQQPTYQEPEEPESTSYESAVSSSIPASQAYKHIGSYRVVCGSVAQVKGFSKGTYLNLGATYPNQDATIVVWNSDAGGFGNLEQYEGRNLCIKGTVDSYKGVPQIKLSSSSQLQ